MFYFEDTSTQKESKSREDKPLILDGTAEVEFSDDEDLSQDHQPSLVERFSRLFK